MRGRSFYLFSLLFGLISCDLGAWENHSQITRVALQTQEGWEQVRYEPIQNLLGRLGSENFSEFVEKLKIRSDHIQWEWKPSSKDLSAFEVLVAAAQEPDYGMDQELRLADYQTHMGGYTGLSSQGVRHMFFPRWNWQSPVVSFHLPTQEMGFAPDRAQLFFDLAVQAKKNGYSFWAYRFLGWCLHYIQDLGQPYHVSQVGSLQLMRPWKLLSLLSYDAYVAETTRVVGNFHLSFEQYTEYLLKNNPDGPSRLTSAFLVPEISDAFKTSVKNSKSIKQAVTTLAWSSRELVGETISIQSELLGAQLFAPQTDLVSGFFDAAGKPKVRFVEIEQNANNKTSRERLYSIMRKALSLTSYTTLWVLDQFKLASSR